MERNIQLLTFFHFLTDFRLYSPIAIIYFSQVSGSFAYGMSVFSVLMITQAFLELPTGIFSDYVGRKKTLVIGSCFAVVSVGLYASGFGYTVLLLGAVCEGLSRTFFSGNNSALLYESVQCAGRENDFADISAKVNSMLQLALGVSALLGAIVAFYYSITLLFWISIIPQIISVFISLFITEPQIHTREFKPNIYSHLMAAIKGFVTNKKLRLLILSDAMNEGVEEVIHDFRPAFVALVWPTWALGVYRAVVHGFSYVSFTFAGKVIRKYTAPVTLFSTSLGSSVLNFISLGISNVSSPLVLAFSDLLYGSNRTAMEAMQQDDFSDEQRATMGSLSGMLGSLLFAVAAIFFGWFADKYGVTFALILGEVVLLTASFLNYRLLKHYTHFQTQIA